MKYYAANSGGRSTPARSDVVVQIARKAGQVVRSPRVQQAARDIAPKARDLVDAVREEWRRAR